MSRLFGLHILFSSLPCYFEPAVSRRIQVQRNSDFNAFGITSQRVAAGQLTSVNPALLAGSAATALLAAGAASILDASTRKLGERELSRLNAIEQNLFNIRTDACVRAWKLHFRTTSAELTLAAAIEHLLMPATRASHASLNRDTTNGTALQETFEELGTKLVEGMRLGVLDAERFVVQSCHKVAEEEFAISSVQEEIQGALTDVQQRHANDMAVLGSAFFLGLFSVFAKVDVKLTGEVLQASKYFSESYQVATVAIDGVEDVRKKQICKAGLLWLYGFAQMLQLISQYCGSDAVDQVFDFFGSLQLGVRDIVKLAKTLIDGDGPLHVFYGVVHILYDACQILSTTLALADDLGWKSANPNLSLVLIQAKFVVLALQEILSTALAIEANMQMRRMLQDTKRINGTALVQDFRDKQCEYLANVEGSIGRQKQMLEQVQVILELRRQQASVLPTTPDHEDVGRKLHEFLKPFCSVYILYCAKLVSTNPIYTVLDASGFSSFIRLRVQEAAAAPVSDIVIVSTESQAASLMTFGFRPAGNFGLDSAEGTSAPQLMVCRGCSSNVVLHVSKRPHSSKSSSSLVSGDPPKNKFQSQLAAIGTDVDPVHPVEVLFLHAPKGLSLLVKRKPKKSLQNSSADTYVLVDLRGLDFLMSDSIDVHSFEEAVMAYLHTPTSEHAESKPGLIRELITKSTWNATVSWLEKLASGFGLLQGFGPAFSAHYSSHALNVVTGSYLSYKNLRQEYTSSGRVYGGFRYLSVTRGYECALRNDPRFEVEHIPLSKLSAELVDETVELQTDLWLHHDPVPPMVRTKYLPLTPAIQKVNEQLGNNIKEIVKSFRANFVGDLDSNYFVDLLKIRAVDQNYCWVQDTVQLPHHVWEAIALPANSGPPGSSQEWKEAIKLKMYGIDEDGNFPSDEQVTVWYRDSRANAEDIHRSVHTDLNRILEAYRTKVRSRYHSLECVSFQVAGATLR